MRGLKLALYLAAAVMVTGGCAQFAPSGHQSKVNQLLAVQLPNDSCQMLGTVTASADCACYDKMSYDRLRDRASENLHRQARQQYPNTDLVEVSSVDLFLNNAKAHGVAYQCITRNSSW